MYTQFQLNWIQLKHFTFCIYIVTIDCENGAAVDHMHCRRPDMMAAAVAVVQNSFDASENCRLACVAVASDTRNLDDYLNGIVALVVEAAVDPPVAFVSHALHYCYCSLDYCRCCSHSDSLTVDYSRIRMTMIADRANALTTVCGYCCRKWPTLDLKIHCHCCMHHLFDKATIGEKKNSSD